MKREQVQGIDSDVRKYVSDSISLSSDYGEYSDPLTGYPEPIKVIEVNGREARIVVYKGAPDFPFLCNIHFPDTGRKGLTLTLGGGAKTEAALETLKKIYGTVQFKTVPF